MSVDMVSLTLTGGRYAGTKQLYFTVKPQATPKLEGRHMSMFLVPKTPKELKKDAKEREAAEAAAKAAAEKQ